MLGDGVTHICKRPCIFSLFQRVETFGKRLSLCIPVPISPRTQETGTGHQIWRETLLWHAMVHHELTTYQPGGAAWAQAKALGQQAPAAHLLSVLLGFCCFFLTLEFLSVACFLWEHPKNWTGDVRSSLRGCSHGPLQADAGKRWLCSAGVGLHDLLNMVPSTN